MKRRIGVVAAVVILSGCEEPVSTVTAPGEDGYGLAAQAGVHSDRAALMALYEATDGANWDDNTNWGTGANLDDWYGVWTNSAGRVTQVVIRDNGLSGHIPAALQGLGALRRLDLSDNGELSGSIPSELGNLGQLRTLAILRTGVSGGIPPELGNLSLLSSLDLRHNGMSGDIPSELGNLSSLEILYLIDIGLSGSIPPELGSLTALRWMHLGSNSLSGQIPAELGNLTGVEDLYLTDNALSGGVPASLGKLGALSRLHLASNQLTGAIPDTFLNLYLDEFSLWDNWSLCLPNTGGFRSWMERMGYPDWSVHRSLCSQDREALLGLHDALDGSNWTNSNWGGDTDIRTWRGVTLDSEVRVTELRLASSGLAGKIPAIMADLDRLRVLVLEGNGLVGELPEAVMDLDLDVFWWSENPGLCVPDTEAFRIWLGDMRSTSGPICGR